MNEQEAIARAEAWYLQRYHAVAHGHITVDAEGHELREEPLVCLDLISEQRTGVVNVMVERTGAGELTLLDEGVSCPRCAQAKIAHG